MKKDNVRYGTLLMSAILAAGSVMPVMSGCGNRTTETENVQENNEEMQTVSALSLMDAVNTKEPIAPTDNFRTWYEVFVYSFYDSDGDGIGDLPGLTAQLDYINDGDNTTDTDLGCNGIWLMPIMPSTTYHKYDVIDYCDIDAQYGTMEDFEVFVEECHERDVNVIIDLVMNHSSTQHEWFQTAADYLKNLPQGAEPDLEACPYVDYYHFSKEKEGGYSELAGSEWYYEAQFWSEMPDLNLASEAVREEFAEIVAFWLDKGVDGFRLDAAKEYYSGNTPANVEVLTWFNEMVKEQKQDAYIVAEVWSDMETYAKYYESGIDSCFNFAFAQQDGTIAKVIKGKASGGDSAGAYGKALERWQETAGAYREDYIDAPFYTNHDVARSAGYYYGDFGENQVKLAQAMNLMMSGSSFLYYGEELGMKGSGKDENKRAPMYWSMDSETEGMCDGPIDMETVEMKYESFAEQQVDGDSIYNFVKEAIGIRNSYPAISHGMVTFEEAYSGDTVCVIRKTYENQEVLLVFNTSAESCEVNLSDIALAGKSGTELAVGSILITDASEVPTLKDGTLTAPAFSVTVLE